MEVPIVRAVLLSYGADNLMLSMLLNAGQQPRMTMKQSRTRGVTELSAQLELKIARRALPRIKRQWVRWKQVINESPQVFSKQVILAL